MKCCTYDFTYEAAANNRAGLLNVSHTHRKERIRFDSSTRTSANNDLSIKHEAYNFYLVLCIILSITEDKKIKRLLINICCIICEPGSLYWFVYFVFVRRTNINAVDLEPFFSLCFYNAE